MAQVDKATFDRLRMYVDEPNGTGDSKEATPARLARVAKQLRLDDIPREVLAAVVVLTVVALVLGIVLAGRTTHGTVVTRGGIGASAPLEATPEDTVPVDAPTEDPAPSLYVHVAGAVAAPGVYALPEGARVWDAVEAAGGFAPDAAHDALNLAQSLADGCKVSVPTVAEAAAMESDAAFGASDAPPSNAPVNLNTASQAELQQLPGIGEATAAAIVEDRARSGPFASVEDLMRVSGIGEKKLERLRGLVTV